MHSFPPGAVPMVPKNGLIGTSTLPILLFGMSRVATLRLLPRCQMNRRSGTGGRSEEHTSELQSQSNLVCRLLLEKKKKTNTSLTDSCYIYSNNTHTHAY